MQMTLRWYGSKFDTVTLKQIRQIPGVTGVISTLYDSVPGEAWEMEDILNLKKEIEAAASKRNEGTKRGRSKVEARVKPEKMLIEP